MKIVLAGGSGQLGQLLHRAWQAQGHTCVVLSRHTTGSAVAWAPPELGPWTETLEGADVVINLAGRSVNCRYTNRHLAEMLSSRLDSTTAIGRAIAACRRPPRVWLQASTATIYAHRFDAANDELTGRLAGEEADAPAKWRASIAIARAWEEAWMRAHTPRTRKLALRTAMVMSPDPGGVFDHLAKLTRRGLGAAHGHGRQFVSWIHEQDFVAAIMHLIERDDLSGIVNICAPHPLPNAAFMQHLRTALGVRRALPAPSPVLELGAWFMRTETELLLKSRRVVPTRLLQSGFNFAYPSWPDAVQELARRWRRD